MLVISMALPFGGTFQHQQLSTALCIEATGGACIPLFEQDQLINTFVQNRPGYPGRIGNRFERKFAQVERELRAVFGIELPQLHEDRAATI